MRAGSDFHQPELIPSRAGRFLFADEVRLSSSNVRQFQPGISWHKGLDETQARRNFQIHVLVGANKTRIFSLTLCWKDDIEVAGTKRASSAMATVGELLQRNGDAVALRAFRTFVTLCLPWPSSRKRKRTLGDPANMLDHPVQNSA